MATKRKPAPLSLKPDFEDAARRWEAYLQGELLDRPLVCVTAPIAGKKTVPGSSYHDRVNGDMDQIIENMLINAEATYFGGEAMPATWLSFGCDEIAAFCGAELHFSPDSPDTCWSKPFVDDWEKVLPLRLQENNPLWQRMLKFYRKAADRLGGKMLLNHLDLHTNGDLLAPIRGPERLCMDMIEQPEVIDRAMADARTIFKKVWYDIAAAGRMDEFGYCGGLYSMEGAAVISCDFCCMIGRDMFRRWILPEYEAESAIVKHAFHHWDGPGALTHEADILACKGFHTIGYVPTVGHGVGRIKHIECLDLLKRCQKAGKAVQAYGTPDEVKLMHRELDPAKVMYCTNTATPQEAEELLSWLVRNT